MNELHFSFSFHFEKTDAKYVCQTMGPLNVLKCHTYEICIQMHTYVIQIRIPIFAHVFSKKKKRKMNDPELRRDEEIFFQFI